MQASGLLKDDIVLSIPTEEGVFDTRCCCVGRWRRSASTAAWLAYAQEQEEADPVVPLLVVQVGGKPTTERWCGRWTRSATPGPNSGMTPWRRLRGAPGPAGRPAGRAPIEPSGCRMPGTCGCCWRSLRSPRAGTARAEVLVSMRPAKDRTHITQLLGRMIRTRWHGASRATSCSTLWTACCRSSTARPPRAWQNAHEGRDLQGRGGQRHRRR